MNLLHQIAHARAGDKGNRLNISVIAYAPQDYPTLVEQVTVDRIRAALAYRNPGPIKRYELPNLGALNFVIDDVLDGGVNASLNLDGHGKCLSYRILAMNLDQT
jgi:hypothetical protein